MNNITIMPDGPKADERAERAKAESIFADKLLAILLRAQGTDHGNDIPAPGGLNAKYAALYDEIWNAAFYVVTAKRKKKEEKQHA